MFFKKKSKQTVNPRSSSAASMQHEPSFIGRDTTVDGHINSAGELHVDGTVRGSIQAKLCVIDMAGIVQGEVSGEVVHVRGRVIGPIQGSSIFIYAGAHVEGEVFHDSISIENGAYVYGTIRHNDAPAPRNGLQGQGPIIAVKPQPEMPLTQPFAQVVKFKK
jgi:cytoskeletal protein CcmA (bactofilin family)